MLSCKELTELVTRYLENDMSWTEKAKFKLHAGMCKHCRQYLDQMKVTVAATGEVPDLTEMPADVREGLRAAFSDWKASMADDQSTP